MIGQQLCQLDDIRTWESLEIREDCSTLLISLLNECTHLGSEPHDVEIVRSITRTYALASCGLATVSKAREAHRVLNNTIVLIGSRRSRGDPERDEQLISNAKMLLQIIGALQHALVRQESEARSADLRRKSDRTRMIASAVGGK